MDYQDLILTFLEYKILYDNKRFLTSRYKVNIFMPDLENYDLPSSEIIVVKIKGRSNNIGLVQKYINRKLELLKRQEKEENDVSIIDLNSDSEDDFFDRIHSDNHSIYEPKHKRRCIEIVNVSDAVPCDTNVELDHSPCELVSTSNADESVIVLDPALPLVSKDESIIILDPLPVEEFIPISTNTQNKMPVQVNNEVVILSDEEDTIDKEGQLQTLPKSTITRKLRPVVIDGSNVARAHGKPQNAFSCKGIKICVEYFLKRGHPQVTAFVPLYRRHCKNSNIPTTDENILEELEKTQHVVFTPSRRIDGKGYSCYDDRFIVKLAAESGGVILSNDNYKDIMNESPAFTETIKNRLLMYCFVGDMLMIPEDPLGSRGPKLNEYLSFPPATEDS